MANIYSDTKNCNQAITLVDKISFSDSIIGEYIKTQGAQIIQKCSQPGSAQAVDLAKKVVAILQKNIDINPHHTPDWLILGQYLNILLEEKIKLETTANFSSPEILALIERANSAFKKASELSPKRPEIYKNWLKTGIVVSDYNLAQEKAQKCVSLAPDDGECYWLSATVSGYQKNTDEFNRLLESAKQKGYNTEDLSSLQQLANMYIKTNEYAKMPDIYLKMIALTPDNKQKAQLYASLATVYKQLGQIQKAREAALTSLDLMPEAKQTVDEFLKSLQ